MKKALLAYPQVNNIMNINEEFIEYIKTAIANLELLVDDENTSNLVYRGVLLDATLKNLHSARQLL